VDLVDQAVVIVDLVVNVPAALAVPAVLMAETVEPAVPN
jgi:hypothetical protein